jgi:hypothetical protein
MGDITVTKARKLQKDRKQALKQKLRENLLRRKSAPKKDS